MSRLLIFIVILFGGFWFYMSIEPYSYDNWWLENILTILTVLLLLLTYQRYPMSTLSYAQLALFLALHTYGAHYSYTMNPIDEWMKEVFGWERNAYDRVVHTAFGMLLYYPVYEWARRLIGIPFFWSAFFSITLIFALGGMYEVIEMVVALIVDPDIGLNFVGFQGDIWDAQKDMILAFIGSLIAFGIHRLFYRSREGKSWDKPNRM